MKCPDCFNELKEIDFRGIKINECVNCAGRWFDREELKRAKDNTDEDLRWLDFNPFDQDAEQFCIPSEGKDCPGCSSKMKSLAYEKSEVVVNKCQSCQGVWLHHGEFKKIINYLNELVVSIPSSEYAKNSLKQFIEIATKADKASTQMKDFLVVLKLLKLRISAEHPTLSTAIDKIFEYLPFL